jgi:hypothetical protein
MAKFWWPQERALGPCLGGAVEFGPWLEEMRPGTKFRPRPNCPARRIALPYFEIYVNIQGLTFEFREGYKSHGTGFVGGVPSHRSLLPPAPPSFRAHCVR